MRDFVVEGLDAADELVPDLETAVEDDDVFCRGGNCDGSCAVAKDPEEDVPVGCGDPRGPCCNHTADD